MLISCRRYAIIVSTALVPCEKDMKLVIRILRMFVGMLDVFVGKFDTLRLFYNQHTPERDIMGVPAFMSSVDLL